MANGASTPRDSRRSTIAFHWSWLSAALLLVAACADTGQPAGTGGTYSPAKLADLWSREVESASRLSLEGEIGVELDGFVQRTPAEYCARAEALANRGEIRQAIREASKALFLGERERNDDMLGLAMHDLAIAYGFAGQDAKARLWAEKALVQAERARFAARRIIPTANKVLGDVALRGGQAAEAKTYYERALQTALPGMRASMTLSLANALLATGDLAGAKQLVAGARGEIKPEFAPYASRTLGRIALAEGRPADAASLFQAGLAQLAGGEDAAYHAAFLHHGLATAAMATGDRAAALDHLQQALQLVEQSASRFRSEELRAGLFGNVQDIIDDHVSLLASMHRDEDAFNVSEAGRARALLDAVGGRVIGAKDGRAFVEGKLKPRRFAEIRAVLPPAAVLVEYHVLKDRTLVWLLRQSGISAVSLPEPRAKLNADVLRLKTAMRDRLAAFGRQAVGHGRVPGLAARPPGLSTPDLALASELYDRLIAPLGLSAGDRDLVLVPHDQLHGLPFQVLRRGDQSLIEERTLTYLPTGSTMAVIAARPRPDRGGILAMGNPDLGSPAFDLPGAQREASRVRELFPSGEVLLRQAATRVAFKAEAPRFPVVHVAAHAEVDEVDPLYSEIRLAPSATEKGELAAYEVYTLDLSHTQLVTLSACDTGRGVVSRGDEPWGFMRAFLSAGASSMIVTLWPVEDSLTEAFMAEFYGRLRAGDAKTAFAAAQRRIRKEAPAGDPFFWGPFILVGDYR